MASGIDPARKAAMEAADVAGYSVPAHHLAAQAMFLDGVRWERTRALEAAIAALVEGREPPNYVRVPPGHRARHVGGRELANTSDSTWIIPSLSANVASWIVEKM